MRKETIGAATLYLGNAAEVLPLVEPVDAVITSPPYAEQRKYGGDLPPWDENMRLAFAGLNAAPGCQVLVNLGLVHKDGECWPYWEQWREWMRASGWRFFAWYVWDQGDGLPGDWNGRLAPSHEFILHFNREARKPNKWMRSKSVGRVITGTGMRKADGTTADKMSHDGAGVNALKIPDSVIRVYREMRRDVGHPAVFPTRLPEELCQSFTDRGQLVLDPFMGSGTTGIASVCLGRRFVGAEINPEYFDLACRRIEDAQRQNRMFA